VILLEVDAASVTIFELECDAPRSVDVNRKARRLKATQLMKVKAGNVHFLGPRDNVQAI